jgi:PhzF family phenazine biosynthesis protein
MKLALYQVDAFTKKLFGGNPAAVCPLTSWLPDEQMAKIAAENNLAETAFFIENKDGFDIRWFTPKVEVDLCGHATLASAHVIFYHLMYSHPQIKFSTRQRGDLFVTRENDLLVLNFPATMPVRMAVDEDIVRALGKNPLEMWKSRDIMVVFNSEEVVRSLDPDFQILKKYDVVGVIATAPGDTVDFVSRFFAPGVGINEDPVTGSAHTTLIPYWSQRLGLTKMHALQVSKRQGELFCEMQGSRVLIGGHAVTYLVGEIQV